MTTHSYPVARLALLTALATSVLVLAGCASMQISSYMETGASLAQYRTWDWGPPDTWSTGDPRLDNNPFFDGRVRAEVERHLAARGFEKVASGTPDLHVHYHATVTQRIEARNLDREYGFCEDDDCLPEIYDSGTLLIDLIDASSDRLVWRGWAEDSIDGVIEDQDWLEAKIDEAVDRIMAVLPVGI